MAENRFVERPDAKQTPAGELSHEEASREVDELREALERFNRAYYTSGEPEVSDATWDRLFSRLQTIEERFDDLRDPASPTKRVGAPPVDELEDAEHTAPMLSLNAVLETGDARSRFDALVEAAGANGAPVVAEPKIDGLSLEAVYEDGVLVRAATRGDGRVGDDVTYNAQTIRSLPLRLAGDAPGMLAVRGEVVLRRDEFVNLNRRRIERGDEPFANPRNAAAGAIRQLDSRAVAEVPLDVICYDILVTEGTDERPATHAEELALIERLGLPISEHNRELADFDELADYRDDLLDRRDDLEVELDGVVVKLNGLAERDSLGVRDRSPRWAFAWKFPPREERTRVREIVVTVGRTGKLTPVALLDPVEIGGVTVSRVSLHNADEVERLDVRVGDLVRVERAGDVIPHVVERAGEGAGERTGSPGSDRGRERDRGRGKPFALPSECPACGTRVVRDGAYHRCPNGLACPAQLAGALEHYGSREALDIEHLGEKTARLLVAEELVRDLAGLYELGAGEIASLEGFAERSAEQLVGAIESTREPPLDRFLYGLGIPGVGRHLARVLALEFDELAALRDADEDRLRAVDEIGDETAGSIRGFFSEARTREVLDRLLEVGVTPQAIERRGGRSTSSVSGETDYLVVGENPGSKLDDAHEHEVPTIDEEGFERLLDSRRP